MKELLIKLKIIHVVSNEERRKAGIKILGKGYFKAYRIKLRINYNNSCDFFNAWICWSI